MPPKPRIPRKLEADLETLNAQTGVAESVPEEDAPSAEEMMEDIFNEDEEQEQQEDSNEPAAPALAPVAAPPVKTVSAPKPRTTSVRTKVNHRCRIGGVTYYFQKGVAQSVPDEVKRVLLKGDLLLPM